MNMKYESGIIILKNNNSTYNLGVSWEACFHLEFNTSLKYSYTERFTNESH